MPAKIRWRYQGTVPLTLGAKAPTFKLSQGLVYREILLRLKATVTIATANNTTANLCRGDEWSLLSQITLTANSSDSVRQMSGDQLRARNNLYGLNTKIIPTLGDGSATYNAGAAIDSSIVIPLWSVGQNKRPMDTAFDSTRYTDFRLELTAGALGSANSINTTASAITGATVDVHTYEHDGASPTDPYGPGGGGFSLRREVVITQALTAGTDVRVDIPVGPMYAGFYVFIRDNSGVPIDSGTVVSNVKLTSGTTTFLDRPWVVLQNESYNYGWDMGAVPRYNYDGSANVLEAPWRNTYESLNGQVFIDLCRDGYFTEALDTNGWGEFTMTLTTTAVGTAYIVPIQVFPPRQ